MHEQSKTNQKTAGFLGVMRSVGILVVIAGALYFLSTFAYFAFYIAGKLTHSVPVARVFDAMGALFLLPGRLVLWDVPTYIRFFPSVIVPANTGAWFVLLSGALLLRNWLRGGTK